ncbi:hypothetical protein MNBD_GAMMA26-24 [hydrothermal vent metagenome]|uniref:Gamma-glutamyltranspeptidase n=1 Tax=hydrothermal vent metagenome TaxID=652676 RepID=A0A3B1AZY5_9ZZZZ
MNKKYMLMKIAAMTLGLGLLAGCATTEQVTRAQETADAALAAANSANSMAADAQRQASAAIVSANQAEKNAAAATAAAARCTEKCSRIMEKTLAK